MVQWCKPMTVSILFFYHIGFVSCKLVTFFKFSPLLLLNLKVGWHSYCVYCFVVSAEVEQTGASD